MRRREEGGGEGRGRRETLKLVFDFVLWSSGIDGGRNKRKATLFRGNLKSFDFSTKQFDQDQFDSVKVFSTYKTAVKELVPLLYREAEEEIERGKKKIKGDPMIKVTKKDGHFLVQILDFSKG